MKEREEEVESEIKNEWKRSEKVVGVMCRRVGWEWKGKWI